MLLEEMLIALGGHPTQGNLLGGAAEEGMEEMIEACAGYGSGYVKK